jgi:hypothetical protein
MKTLIIIGIVLAILINVWMIKELISPTCCKYARVSFDNCCQDNLKPSAATILISEAILGFIVFALIYLP